MEFLSGLFSSISRDLLCGVVSQLRYPCCFNTFVKELGEEEANLITRRKDVKDRIAHAKKQTRRTAEDVHKWDEDADKYADDVKKLLNEARTKQNCCFGHCPDWIFRYRSGKKLANKKTELEEFIRKGGPYVLLERVATLPSGILDWSSEKYLSFGSRQKAYEELMEAVKDDEVGMIGLYGMGGCGKTTMAEEVKKKAEADHLFDKVLFVPVSSTVEVRKIQDKIASSMQYTFPENEERERAQRLYRRLKQENKVLVILDDVWEKLDFASIGIPSTDDHKGCKVLITTRSKDVCTLNDCQKKIQLQVLTNEEAWVLFQKQARISESTSGTLKHLARQISDECKGLPVAIAAVASTLKGKDEVIWEVALNRLKSSKPVDIEKGLQDPYKCLELSYDNLENEAAKSLFLLCSVFPEDYEIPIELLARCAIGLGVVGEVRSYEEARNEVIAAKIKLVSCCLLLDAPHYEYECVKMHDLVRDVAHLIAKKENKGIKCLVENDLTLEQNSVRYLWCDKLPNDLDCSILEFLCITTQVEVLDESFTRMGQLRVLGLLNEGGRLPLSTMPFKTLTNLRCLILSRWELRDISFVRDMKKLESLSLSKCSFPDLQKDDAVTQLTKLKSLLLDECEMERNILEVIGRMPQLEELCIVDKSEKWDDYSENTIELYKTFIVPQTVQRYAILFGTGWDLDLIALSPPERSLALGCFDKSNEVIVGMAKKANKLYMGNIEGGAKNIIPNIFELEGGDMPELKELHIRDSKEIECLVDSSNHTSEVVGSLFSELLQLYIYEMDGLRFLWHGCLPPSGTFRKLESLYLRDCPRLISLFFTQAITPNSVRHTIFQNLQEVVIDGCGELKYVFSANTVGGLPQLESLKIRNCDKLEQIVEDIIPSNPVRYTIFQNLQHVKISKCGELKYVFSANTVGGLPQLESLKIRNCDKLEQIVEDIIPSNPVRYTIFQNLQHVDIDECGELKYVFSANTVGGLPQLESLKIRICDKLEQIVEDIIPSNPVRYTIFQNLQHVDIYKCGELKYVFSANTVGGLPQLESLKIRNCDKLEQIVEDIIPSNPVRYTIFQNLQHVDIDECGELKYVFSANTVGGLPQLESLEIWNCDKLEQIVEDIIPSNPVRYTIFQNLQHVDIDGCGELKYVFSANTVGGLPQLESLKIWHCHKLEQIVEDIIPSNPARYTIFQNLQHVDIYECGELKYVFSANTVGGLPQLKSLEIWNCDKLEQIVEDIIPSNPVRYTIFQNLQHVTIEECGELKYVFSANTVGGLPQLESLKIWNCDKLEQIVEDIIPSNPVRYTIFQNLQHVDIYECGELKYVFSANTVGGLPQLKSLKIWNCDKLEQIVEDIIPSNPVRYTIFQNLQHVNISKCGELKYVFSANTVGGLPQLKSLEIRNCDKLEQIVEDIIPAGGNELEIIEENTSTLSPPLLNHSRGELYFPKLKKVKIDSCHKLKRLFSTSAFNDLPNLEILDINGADELEELIGCEQGASNNFQFQHLKTLEIMKCAKLEVIFPVYVARCLPELEDLYIKECKELKHIMEEDENDQIERELKLRFPKLKIVAVGRCHKLKRLFSTSACNDLPNLEILIINGAHELEELIGCEQGEDEEIGNAIVKLPQLKHLIFMHLLNLCQEIELRAIKHCIIDNCPKLSLTSTTTLHDLRQNILDSDFPDVLKWKLEKWIRDIKESNKISKSRNTTESPSSQSNGSEVHGSEVHGSEVHGSEVHAIATSTNSELNGRPSLSPLDVCQHETHSHELVNGQASSGSYLKDQQKPLGEIESTIAIPQNIKIIVEEGTASENGMTVSGHIESTSSQMSHKSYTHEWDSKTENTSSLQMNQEDPSTSKSKSPCSQVSDNNQSILGSMAKMAREHKQSQNEAPVSKTDEFLELEGERKMKSHSQLLEQNLPFISSPNMTKNIKEIGKEIIQERSKSMRATIKTLSTGVESISLANGISPNPESSGWDILIQHSQVVDQELSLLDKKEEIPTRATSLKNSIIIERQSMSEPCWMNQRKPLGEFISSPEISQDILGFDTSEIHEQIAASKLLNKSSTHDKSWLNSLQKLEIQPVLSTAGGGDNQESPVKISHDSTADVEIVEPFIDAEASKANLSMSEDIGESHPSEEVVEETAMKQDPKNDESETWSNHSANPFVSPTPNEDQEGPTYTTPTPDESDDEFEEYFKAFDIPTEWEQGLIPKAECEIIRSSFREKAFSVDILTIASEENLKVEVQEAAAKLLSFGVLVPEKERVRIQMFLDLLDEVVCKVKLEKNQQIQIDNIKNTSLEQMNQIEFAKQQANTSKLSFKENKSELAKLNASEKVLIQEIAALQLQLSCVQSEKQTLECRQNDIRQTIKSSAAHAKSVAEQLKPQLEKKLQLETSQVELAESLKILKNKHKTQAQNYFM